MTTWFLMATSHSQHSQKIPRVFTRSRSQPSPISMKYPNAAQILEWNSLEIPSQSANKGTHSLNLAQFVSQDEIA